MTQKYNVAVAGATGAVGSEIIQILEQRNFPIDNLYLLASSKSKGKKLEFKEKEIIVDDLAEFDFSKAHIGLFSPGGKISAEYAPKAASTGCIVIDNTSHFRMQKNIPLIVPEVNSNTLEEFFHNEERTNIISNPNCSTIQMLLVLKPLHDKYNIKRVVVSTYQAVSGAGKAPMDELISQSKDFLDGKKINSKNFTKQIAFNLIPHIDEFIEEGYTKEEWKMINETKKILDPNIKLTATCVRVPVMVSHAESLNVEFEESFEIEKVKNILEKSKGCKVLDERKNGGYITPLEAENSYFTFISRIRKDTSNNKSLNLWVVSDNLLKGAALNTVQIAETLIEKYYGK